MLEGLVRSFLYHPIQLDQDAPMPPYILGAQEVWCDSKDGNRIHGLYWPAPAGRPTILFFHGNAQSVFEWALISEEFAPMESGLLLVDYPGYGKSSGEPNEEGLYEAGHAAFAWLIETANVQAKQILLFGKSLGGPVATEVARGRQVLGLILESTFRSVQSVARILLPMLPADAELKSERYATEERIGDVVVPILVIHGTQDELIPVSEGKALFEQAGGSKELYLVQGAGHNDVSYFAGKEYGATIRRWMDGLQTATS